MWNCRTWAGAVGCIRPSKFENGLSLASISPELPFCLNSLLALTLSASLTPASFSWLALSSSKMRLNLSLPPPNSPADRLDSTYCPSKTKHNLLLC